MRGYLVHEHPDQTNEGFASSVHTHLFPFLHIALTCNLQPIISCNPSKISATDDSVYLSNFNEFLSIPDESSLPTNNVREVVIHTWSGNHYANGDPNLVAQEILDDYFEHYKDNRVLVVQLQGPLRSTDPTPIVYKWLQDRSLQWNGSKNSSLRIAAHVGGYDDEDSTHSFHGSRVGTLLLATLDKLKLVGFKVEKCELDIYSEKSLPLEDELMLRQKYSSVRVHSCSDKTLLSDIKAMAVADMFIPSSCFLSAFIGYLTHGVIVISDESRWQYFRCHRELRCALVEVTDLESTNLIQKKVPRKIPSPVVPLRAGWE